MKRKFIILMLSFALILTACGKEDKKEVNTMEKKNPKQEETLEKKNNYGADEEESAQDESPESYVFEGELVPMSKIFSAFGDVRGYEDMKDLEMFKDIKVTAELKKTGRKNHLGNAYYDNKIYIKNESKDKTYTGDIYYGIEVKEIESTTWLRTDLVDYIELKPGDVIESKVGSDITKPIRLVTSPDGEWIQ